jgi:hypothetical protein
MWLRFICTDFLLPFLAQSFPSLGITHTGKRSLPIAHPNLAVNNLTTTVPKQPEGHNFQ